MSMCVRGVGQGDGDGAKRPRHHKRQLWSHTQLGEAHVTRLENKRFRPRAQLPASSLLWTWLPGVGEGRLSLYINMAGFWELHFYFFRSLFLSIQTFEGGGTSVQVTWLMTS